VDEASGPAVAGIGCVPLSTARPALTVTTAAAADQDLDDISKCALVNEQGQKDREEARDEYRRSQWAL
jgi:hypothetical protein